LQGALARASALLVALLVLVAAAGAAGLLLTARSEEQGDRAERMRDSSTAMMLAVTDMETGVRGYRLARDRAFLQPYLAGRGDFAAAAAATRDLALDDAERALVEQQVEIEERWRRTYADPVSATAPSSLEVSQAFTRRNKQLVDAFRAANGRLDARLAAQVDAAAQAQRDVRRAALALVLAALALALGVAAVVARRTSAAVVTPLVGLEGVLRRLAEGDHGARAGRVAAPHEVQQVARTVDALADEADRLRTDARETERLREVAHAVGRRVRDQIVPERVMEEAVSSLAEALRVDRAHVRLCDRGAAEEGVLGAVGARWPATGEDPYEGGAGCGDAGWLRRLHAGADVLAVDDLRDGDRTGAEAAAALAPGAAATALLAAPLAGGQGPAGVLVLLCTRGPRRWHQREVEAVRLVAADLGRALVLARVYRDQQDLVERLQELDRSKTEFMSTVSHELRTPLTSIAGYLELLRDGDAGPLAAEQDAMLEVVERNTRRLKLLIEDLLTLSRIEARAWSSERQPVAVAELVARAAETVLPSAQHEGVRLQVEPPPAGAAVLGDAGQLERVLLNLLSNAVKFTPAGGRVRLGVAVLPDRVRLEVEDDGIGIPEAEQDRLFQRFFRASNAVAAAVQGTGLGLTIVRSIVEGHDGSLELRSAQGRGTTVSVLLPRAPGGTAGPTAALSPTVVPLAH
jgi:signal transduction histidine kinase/CHASE3 domain sensor protein